MNPSDLTPENRAGRDQTAPSSLRCDGGWVAFGMWFPTFGERAQLYADYDSARFEKRRRDALHARKSYEKLRSQRLRSARSIATHSSEEWDALVRFCGGCVKCIRESCSSKRCVCTRREFIGKDHIVPLCLGGHDGIENIQPLCLLCNSTKGGRASVDYRPAAWRGAVL